MYYHFLFFLNTALYLPFKKGNCFLLMLVPGFISQGDIAKVSQFEFQIYFDGLPMSRPLTLNVYRTVRKVTQRLFKLLKILAKEKQLKSFAFIKPLNSAKHSTVNIKRTKDRSLKYYLFSKRQDDNTKRHEHLRCKKFGGKLLHFHGITQQIVCYENTSLQ